MTPITDTSISICRFLKLPDLVLHGILAKKDDLKEENYTKYSELKFVFLHI